MALLEDDDYFLKSSLFPEHLRPILDLFHSSQMRSHLWQIIRGQVPILSPLRDQWQKIPLAQRDDPYEIAAFRDPHFALLDEEEKTVINHLSSRVLGLSLGSRLATIRKYQDAQNLGAVAFVYKLMSSRFNISEDETYLARMEKRLYRPRNNYDMYWQVIMNGSDYTRGCSKGLVDALEGFYQSHRIVSNDVKIPSLVFIPASFPYSLSLPSSPTHPSISIPRRPSCLSQLSRSTTPNPPLPPQSHDPPALSMLATPSLRPSPTVSDSIITTQIAALLPVSIHTIVSHPPSPAPGLPRPLSAAESSSPRSSPTRSPTPMTVTPQDDILEEETPQEDMLVSYFSILWMAAAYVLWRCREFRPSLRYWQERLLVAPPTTQKINQRGENESRRQKGSNKYLSTERNYGIIKLFGF